MTKIKCDVCGEKHDKIHVVCECSDCYINGIAEELKKVLKEYLINSQRGSSTKEGVSHTSEPSETPHPGIASTNSAPANICKKCGEELSVYHGDEGTSGWYCKKCDVQDDCEQGGKG